MLPAYISGKKSTLSSIIVAVGLGMTFINAITPNPINMVVVVALTLMAFIMESIGKPALPNSLLPKAVRFIVVMWICGVMCSVVWSKSDLLCLGDLELLLYGVFVSLIISYRNISVLPLQVVFYLISAYLANRCIIENAGLKEIFFYSTNGYMISVLLSIAILIQFVEWRERKTISILPPFVIFVLSFYGWSRTGLGCALIYLLVVLFFIINGKIKLGRTLTFILFAVIIAGVGFYLWTKFGTILSDNELVEKIDEHGMSTTGRSGIWEVYFSDMNIISLIFGVNVESGPIFKEFSGDVHNSYLQLHATIGLVGIWVVYYVIKGAKMLYEKDRFLFSLFFVLLIRGAFDSLFFWNVYDFAIMIFLIFAFQSQRVEKEHLERTNVRLSIL